MIVKCIKDNPHLTVNQEYLVLECSKDDYRIIDHVFGIPGLYNVEYFEILDSNKSKMIYVENNGYPCWTHKSFLGNFWEEYFDSKKSIELIEQIQFALNDLNSVHNIKVFPKGNFLSLRFGYNEVEPEYANILRKRFIYNFVDDKNAFSLKEDFRFDVECKAVLDHLKELNGEIYLMCGDDVISLNGNIASYYINYDNNCSHENRLFPNDVYIFDHTFDWYIAVKGISRICYSSIPL